MDLPGKAEAYREKQKHTEKNGSVPEKEANLQDKVKKQRGKRIDPYFRYLSCANGSGSLYNLNFKVKNHSRCYHDEMADETTVNCLQPAAGITLESVTG